MKALLKLGNSIFFVFALFWLYFTVYYVFDFFKTTFTQLTDLDAKILVLLPLLFLLLFQFRTFCLRWLRFLCQFLLKHQLVVLIGLLVSQVFLIVTSLGLAVGDTTELYRLAADPQLAQTTSYISFNPNNYLLFLWFKGNHLLFGDNSLIVLALWNAVFIDAAIWLTAAFSRRAINKRTGDLVFLSSNLLLGLQPQHLYTYSDAIALLLVSAVLYLITRALQEKNLLTASLAGLVFALSYGFRPPTLIFIMAGAIVLVARWIEHRQFSISQLKLGLVFLLSFISLTLGISYSLNHQSVVAYQPGQSRTLLYYLDLGLTYNGSDHADLPQEVVEAIGADRGATALADIRRRLANYDLTTFVGHLSYKYYWMTNEGMFGWLRESVLDEDKLPAVPLLASIQRFHLARLVRTYVYVEGDNHYLYAMFFQLIWIVISAGLLLYPFFFTTDKPSALWMQITIFGALLFLLLFEAGRSRYLIQFLPAILIISSIGWSKFYERFFSTP